MHPQTFSYFGGNLQPKETSPHVQSLDYPYSPCRMQSPNYYSQGPLPNFMTAMPQSNHSQVNGYSVSHEGSSFQPHSAQLPSQPQAPNPIDHQSYFGATSDPNQNCSFHQYAWIKSTTNADNWWPNSSTGQSKHLVSVSFT